VRLYRVSTDDDAQPRATAGLPSGRQPSANRRPGAGVAGPGPRARPARSRGRKSAAPRFRDQAPTIPTPTSPDRTWSARTSPHPVPSRSGHGPSRTNRTKNCRLATSRWLVGSVEPKYSGDPVLRSQVVQSTVREKPSVTGPSSADVTPRHRRRRPDAGRHGQHGLPYPAQPFLDTFPGESASENVRKEARRDILPTTLACPASSGRVIPAAAGRDTDCLSVASIDNGIERAASGGRQVVFGCSPPRSPSAWEASSGRLCTGRASPC